MQVWRAVIRWTAAAVLLSCALVAGWLALEETQPRGVLVRVYDNLRWSGEPVEQRISRHIDYTPELRRNRVALPERSSMRMDGWLYCPRRGEYEFALEATDDVWLRLDGRTVVAHRRGRPQTFGKVRLERGFHELRLQIRHRKGDSKLRVYWRLPSGYMDLEALSPVHIHPERPVPGPVVPTPLRYGPILLVLLALLVVLGPRIARFLRRLRSDPAFRVRVAGGVLLLVLTVGFRHWELNGAGETSDEWAYAAAGRNYVSNIAHGYYQSVYWHNNEEHPPIGKYLYGVVSHVAGTDDMAPLRSASAVLAGLTVLLTYLFGCRFLTPWVGFIAGVVLAFLPPFVAHGKVAGLDSPSAFLFTAGVYLFVRALCATEHKNRWYLMAGLVASLAFATKFSNVLLFVFMVAVHFASQWRRIRERGSLELPLPIFFLPFLPLIVLFAVWPWLWREPFGQLVTTLQHWNYPIVEWFFGQHRQPPWYYFPVAFVATTPALLMVAFGAWLYDAARRRTFMHLVVLLWFLTPFIWTLSALKQDGVRYIYSMYPPLALMIGAGICRFTTRGLLRAASTALCAVYLLWQCWSVHPYYLDYYSETVGGPATVWKHSLLEVGWWGEGMDKAYEYVNETAPEGATWDALAVVNHTTDALRADLVYSREDPDYLIRTYVTPNDIFYEGYTEVYRVEVDSAPLVLVYRRDSSTGPSAPDVR